MIVEIDQNSGFCFGVVYAIQKAEEVLKSEKNLFCLGDIVHNNVEVERLSKLGLKTINHEEFKRLKNCKVLIRAHGEPPETYRVALENNIELIDASCPVVLKLQNKIKNGYDTVKLIDGQLVIYGKQGHAEVNGLVGQTMGNAIVINSIDDLSKIDFSKPVYIFSQTTQSKDGFFNISNEIKKRLIENGLTEDSFIAYDTICRQVSSREPQLKKFSSKHDVIIFVSGKKSSNGQILFQICKSVNTNSYFVSIVEDLKAEWFVDVKSVGICGATSTPMWLMKEIEEKIKKYNI